MDYFIKINIAVALFCLVYRQFYGSDSFFSLRRTILLSMTGLSVLYPLLDLTALFSKSELITDASILYVGLLPTIDVVASKQSSFTWKEMLLAGYIVVGAMLALKAIVQLIQLVVLRFTCRTEMLMGQKVYILTTDDTPFSFFNWIFINPDNHQPEEIIEILEHEATHVHEHHSLDVLLSELLVIVCWINPFAWRIRTEIRKNLEFLADSRVIKSGVDLRSYQYHLLRLSHTSIRLTLGNHINISPLKERIMMMNKKQSPKIKLATYTLLLPFALLLFVANNAEALVRNLPRTIESVVVSSNPETKVVGAVVDENGKPMPGVNVVIKGTSNGTVTDKDGKFTIKAPMGSAIFFSYVGMQSVTYNVSKAGATPTISMLSANIRAEDVVVVAYGTKKQMNEPLAGKASTQSQETMDASKEKMVFTVVEEMPEFPGGMQEMLRYIATNIKYPAESRNNGMQGRVITTFVVTKNGTLDDIQVISGVDQYLDAEAIRIVRSMPPWKPGKQRGVAVSVKYTVPINFRLSPPSDNGTVSTEKQGPITVRHQGPITVRYPSQKDGTPPLFLVDGKEVESIDAIDPNTIESINVLKDSTSVRVYGDKGKNGVIMISLKEK